MMPIKFELTIYVQINSTNELNESSKTIKICVIRAQWIQHAAAECKSLLLSDLSRKGEDETQNGFAAEW